MLLVLVAGLLGGVGLVSVAGGVTLAATSHPIPTELWTTASVAIGGLAALLAGHSVSTSQDSPPGGGVVNQSTIFSQPVGDPHGPPPATGASPPAGLGPHDVVGGHPDLRSPRPAAPRAAPARASLPPRPSAVTKRQARARKATTRRR